MALSHILAAVWFILVGLSWMAWVAISVKFLGIWAFVTGIVWLVEGWYPLNLPLRRTQ